MAESPVASASSQSTRPELGVALMIGSALLACAGQVCWKLGAERGWLLIGVGLVLYGLGALTMLLAYRHGEVSTLQPILALSYALSLLVGVAWLGEHASIGRILGVLVVIIGVVVIAGGRAPRPAGAGEAP